MKTLNIGQNCSLNDACLSACLKDNIEIVVFGKGVGECIVVKTATNKVIVVDSFINDETGNPIALDYLEKVGIKSDAIKCLVLTHFHDDHIKGAYNIIQKSPNAKLVVNPFIGHINFLRAISEKRVSSNGDSLSGVGEICSLMKDGKKLETASINKTLFVDEDDKDFSIISLSPHDSELFSYLDSLVSDERKTILEKYSSEKENIYSVVLLVKSKNCCFLLGGDYTNKQGDINEGWSIITEEYKRTYNCKSIVFKVPHHGSSTAQNDGVWKDMLYPNPFSVSTVYNRGHKVPSDKETVWIANRSKEFYLNGGYKSDPDIETLFRKTLGTTKVFVKSGKVGFTRFIVDKDSFISLECFGQVVKYQN